MLLPGMRGRARDYAVLLIFLSAAGCRRAEGPPPPSAANTGAAPAAATTNPTPATAASDAAASPSVLDNLVGALGRGRGLPLPEGLVPGGDCPPAPSDAAQEIAAQADAAIPLVEGLTFAYLWTPAPKEEYECLIQVKSIDGGGIVTTASCDSPGGHDRSLRRICRADLRSARLLHTLYGVVKVIGPSGEEEPETITGATAFSLSIDDFARLKRTGVVTYHYVELAATGQLVKEAVGELRGQGRETMDVIVNDRPVSIPVIRARGTLKCWVRGERLEAPQTIVILDDERFPLLIDQENDATGLGIRFAKITYARRGRGAPGDGVLQMSGGRGAGSARSLEQGLLEDKRVDVYGVYFDFNSDRIRPESEPVLQEIGAIMKLHPDWRLNIQGHTDNVGGNGPANLELSRRRSAAVQSALVTRFGISADRLTSGGSGAASPKDTNDTPEGRARNRRVELVRQ